MKGLLKKWDKQGIVRNVFNTDLFLKIDVPLLGLGIT